MGWYREYLEDLAEIAAEKAREEGEALGCLFKAGLIIFIICFICELFHCSNHDEEKSLDTKSNNELSHNKTSVYLQGVDEIENPTELRNFYYKIASDFHNNEMGLKGPQEQINAGNKIMSGVYGFLGTSVSKGDLLNVDSMKAFIQNDSVISDYRKKKALEELELGIRKISSIQ